jgi:uncharacterized membrane protein YbaN (DUF454 family)
MVVVTAAGICTLTMLIVGILGFVPKTTPLTNFLIFVACVWSFFNVARMFLASDDLTKSMMLKL